MGAETDNLKSSSKADAKTTWAQEFHKIVIPSLVTAVVGFFIWNAQNRIQQKVDENNQMLQTQMALKEEFFKRRLTKYEEACGHIALVKNALDEAGAGPESDAQALTALHELNVHYERNSLFWSDDLQKGLGCFWQSGVDKFRGKQVGDCDENRSVMDQVSGLYGQMKKDLAVKDLGQILSVQQTPRREGGKE